MNKEQLRELLHQEYKTENWKKITEFVFPNVQYLQRPQVIPFSNDKVESFNQIGNVKLTDGKNLAMFEVKVAQNVNLARNRVELRKLVEKLIDQERNHGVLVIYEQGKEDYRFTFTAKSTEFDEDENDFVDHETDAKRFTYILGKNESCKTAANRFWELSTHKDTATIKDVENAFSVERLNKEFFNKYKAFYEDFVQYITGKRFVKEKGKWVEKKLGRARPIYKEVFGSDDKLARNFVKLLLGRLVFIQFLQKKGWMGVPAVSKKWENGDPEFLFNLYKTAKNKEEFHSKYLYPLFYKAFNTPDRTNDIFTLTGTRVPYLNGGLFENENPETKNIDFPATYFGDLLEFFGQYNFTIDENDPQDHEVGIDPEMLGHIFENLLEDNKDKGAFYTPKPIVQYMCQESLIQYLKTYLQEKQVWPEQEDAAAQTEIHLQNFVRKKIAGELLNNYDEHLARALKDVKICDPAIGSGAFPMGLLNEIFYCTQVLCFASDSARVVWEMEEWAPDVVKKNIIQHSIYGVDIEKGAVDIARLRFWLSLIVDEQEPTPLPNLDFKIMQGNSLLESHEGIDLSKIASTQTVVTEVAHDLFGNPVNAQASIFDKKFIEDSNISELIDNYFNTREPDEKQKLKNEIDRIIHKHIDYNLEFEENKILITTAEIKRKLNLLKAEKNHSAAVAAKTKRGKEKLTKELEFLQGRFGQLKEKRKELHNLQKTVERPYFLWNLFFKDVFDKGGFDIVVGNPPYVSNKKIRREFKQELEVYYKTAIGQYDLFSIFIEKSISILKQNGCHSFIIPDSYIGRSTFKESRKSILTEASFVFLLQINQVFKEANVASLIYILNKSNKEGQIQFQKSETLSDWIKGKLLQTVTTKKTLLQDPNYKLLNISSKHRAILYKLLKYDTLGSSENSIIWRGEEIGRDSEYIISRVTDFPIIDGSNVSQFKISRPDCYINKKNIGKDVKLYAQRKIVVRQLGQKINAAIDNRGYINLQSIYNIVPLKHDIYFVLALLNSDLVDFIYQNYIKEKMEFPRILVENLAEIPISYNNTYLVKQISDLGKFLSKQILEESLKKCNALIYKLYELSFEEVKEINPSFHLTHKEYTSI